MSSETPVRPTDCSPNCGYLWAINFELTGFTNSIDAFANILGSLTGKLWNLDSKLGPPDSTSAERRIIASRQHKAADLLGEFPNALRALYSLGMKVRYAAEVAPLYALHVPADNLGNEVAWRESYRDRLVHTDLGSDPNEWKAFCRRFKERLPPFDSQKVRTLLSLEKAAAEQAGIATVGPWVELPDDEVNAILAGETADPKGTVGIDWLALLMMPPLSAGEIAGKLGEPVPDVERTLRYFRNSQDYGFTKDVNAGIGEAKFRYKMNDVLAHLQKWYVKRQKKAAKKEKPADG